MCQVRVTLTTHKFSTTLGGEIFTIPENRARKFLQILNQSNVNWLYEFGAVNPGVGSLVVRPDVSTPSSRFETVVPVDEIRFTCVDAGKTILVLEGQEE